jgi:hypothetical protein
MCVGAFRLLRRRAPTQLRRKMREARSRHARGYKKVFVGRENLWESGGFRGIRLKRLLERTECDHVAWMYWTQDRISGLDVLDIGQDQWPGCIG